MQYYAPLGDSATATDTDFYALVRQLDRMSTTTLSRVEAAKDKYLPTGSIPQMMYDALSQNIADLNDRYAQAVDAGMIPAQLPPKSQRWYKMAAKKFGAAKIIVSRVLGPLKRTDEKVDAYTLIPGGKGSLYRGQANTSGTAGNKKLLLAAAAGVAAFFALK